MADELLRQRFIAAAQKYGWHERPGWGRAPTGRPAQELPWPSPPAENRLGSSATLRLTDDECGEQVSERAQPTPLELTPVSFAAPLSARVSPPEAQHLVDGEPGEVQQGRLSFSFDDGLGDPFGAESAASEASVLSHSGSESGGFDSADDHLTAQLDALDLSSTPTLPDVPANDGEDETPAEVTKLGIDGDGTRGAIRAGDVIDLCSAEATAGDDCVPVDNGTGVGNVLLGSPASDRVSVGWESAAASPLAAESTNCTGSQYESLGSESARSFTEDESLSDDFVVQTDDESFAASQEDADWKYPDDGSEASSSETSNYETASSGEENPVERDLSSEGDDLSSSGVEEENLLSTPARTVSWKEATLRELHSAGTMLEGLRFSRSRAQLTARVFDELNEIVFKSRLEEVPVSWSKTLNTTAGTTKLLTRRATNGAPEVRAAEIVLGQKVVDNSQRLLCTLLHEMCHAAVFLLAKDREGPAEGPHGTAWKNWVAKARKKVPFIAVKTRHDYPIRFKYRYECTECDASWSRHSKSIDTGRQRCGTCKAQIRLVTSAPSKAPSAFNTFTQKHFSRLREMHPDWTFGEVSKEVGKLYRESKGEILGIQQSNR